MHDLTHPRHKGVVVSLNLLSSLFLQLCHKFTTSISHNHALSVYIGRLLTCCFFHLAITWGGLRGALVSTVGLADFTCKPAVAFFYHDGVSTMQLSLPDACVLRSRSCPISAGAAYSHTTGSAGTSDDSSLRLPPPEAMCAVPAQKVISTCCHSNVYTE